MKYLNTDPDKWEPEFPIKRWYLDGGHGGCGWTQGSPEWIAGGWVKYEDVANYLNAISRRLLT